MRDVISAEMWEAINSFHLGLADAAIGVDRLRRPVLVRQLRQEPLGALLGRRLAHDAARRGLRLPRRRRALRVRRHGAADAARRAAGAGRASARRRATARRSRCSARSAACRPTAARSPRRRRAAAVASFLLYTRSYPDSVAASIDAVRDALELADANPRASEPVLRLSRVLADLEFRARVGRRDGDELLEVCELVGRELALADADIAERYFGGVRRPASRASRLADLGPARRCSSRSTTSPSTTTARR